MFLTFGRLLALALVSTTFASITLTPSRHRSADKGTAVEASPERPDAAPRVQPLLLVLSLLTLVTGLVDAACYLGLGRVFTAQCVRTSPIVVQRA